MIALCVHHHPKADAGAFTVDQLRQMKENARQNAASVLGRFDWMRRKLLAVVGGNFHYEPTGGPLMFNGQLFVGIKRDEDGYMLVDVHMPTITSEPRLVMEENFWLLQGNPSDFECPPSGRLINASYPNGDKLRIEFFDIADLQEALKTYGSTDKNTWDGIDFPITAMEVTGAVGGTDIKFGSNKTTSGRSFKMAACMFKFCHGHSLDFRIPAAGGVTGGQLEGCKTDIQGDRIILNMPGSGSVSGAHFHSAVEFRSDALTLEDISWTLDVGGPQPLQIPDGDERLGRDGPA